jgi:transcription elongation factor S-II
MDEIEMVDKNKKKEISMIKENELNSARSDWSQKHAKVTPVLYKCRKCGGNKTTQFEMQTRSADEPMTIFINCVDCGNSWRI